MSVICWKESDSPFPGGVRSLKISVSLPIPFHKPWKLQSVRTPQTQLLIFFRPHLRIYLLISERGRERRRNIKVKEKH